MEQDSVAEEEQEEEEEADRADEFLENFDYGKASLEQFKRRAREVLLNEF